MPVVIVDWASGFDARVDAAMSLAQVGLVALVVGLGLCIVAVFVAAGLVVVGSR